jgi:dipeptidyl aminopeptidase/acylaminoacyl peptidase
MRRLTFVLLLAVPSLSGFAQTPYKLPPKEIVDIIDAPEAPMVVVSPDGSRMMQVEFRSTPSIAFVAQPFVRLAGTRINPRTASTRRITQYTGIVIKSLESNKELRVQLPANSNIDVPVWSSDGKTIAFTRDASGGLELWVADATTGESRRLEGVLVHDVLNDPFHWMSDSRTLLVSLVPPGRGEAPEPPAVPTGPNIDESYGKTSRPPTFQDLLRTPYDEELFEYYATSQLALVDTRSGGRTLLGSPGMILASEFSPNERYLAVLRLMRPFSYRVPYWDFTRSYEVWDAKGELVRTIAQLPVADDVPTQGVPKGPRSGQWQELRDARLLWVEALDEGDPLKKVPFRDRLLALDAPFTGPPVEIMEIQHRYSGLNFLPFKDRVILREFDRDRRWQTLSLLSLAEPKERTVLFDLSVNDAYNNPGSPVYRTDKSGRRMVIQAGDWIYLAGSGATPQGDRPFLRQFNLKSKETRELFRSSETGYETFVAFAGEGFDRIITRSEDPKHPPNFYLTQMRAKQKTALTDFPDPAPQLTGLTKKLLTYSRKDGVLLSGTLYLPASYTPGSRLPLVVWAYPLEFSDPSTAGQVRGSPNRFTFFRGTSPLFYVTQGYALLMDATMPVVGDPETVNNTFIEQIVTSAKAAIDTLDAMGVVDPARVLVSGHSYGAFMTANLLAHSDLFAAGIARSGAYNRTLTPFGFQSERRSLWEAPELYFAVSPFMHADKINEPLLLIHGEADDNSGTFPIQSERMFQAIKGNGGSVRLVMLPAESHGYNARESVLHVLAESLEWADKYVKNKATGK